MEQIERPSTPDSQLTAHPDAFSITPFRKTRLNELVKYDNGAVSDHDLDSSATAGDEPHNSSTKQKTASFSTFNPPESPNVLSPNNHFKSLGMDLSQVKQ